MTKEQRRRRAAAKARLCGEPLVPLEEVAAILGHPPRTVRRWAESGNGGIYLDAYEKEPVGWVSSVEAARRLLRAFWERDELEREHAEEMARRGVRQADISAGVPGR